MGLESFDLSRSDVEHLLPCFLAGTHGVELKKRLTDLADLPSACRTLVKRGAASGRT